jgi:predicted transcriptional regulator
LPPNVILDDIEVSFEVCSEAPLHHAIWPSDITLGIGNAEIGTWTSPADFGGERGALTPTWWDSQNSQYGLLKVWKVTNSGSFVDGIQISKVTLNHLTLKLGEPFPSSTLAYTVAPPPNARIGSHPARSAIVLANFTVCVR